MTYVEFYETYFKIVYPFKFFNRSQVIKYNEVVRVIDIFPNTKFENPRIKLIVKEKTNVEWPSNTFPVFSFKKRKRILLFLKSKGISIEIRSNFEKEHHILE